jgi:RHS repeat-associated protein
VSQSESHRSRRVGLPRRPVLKVTTWMALIAQLAVGVPTRLLAREVRQVNATRPVPTPTPPPPTPAVHVNRTVPKVSSPSARPTFSADPTDAEITSARVFGEPLITIGRGTLPGENSALASAVTHYLDAHNPEQVLPFLGFLKTYPDSPWRASLLLNLGITYRHTGYFLRALEVWEQVWQTTKTRTDPTSRAVADRAVGELFALNARLGRFDRLEALFTETKDRVVTGPATEQITAAREGLWMMRNTPEKAFLCGPLAVDQVLAATRAGYVRDEKILQAKSTQQGTSLAQMQKLAADLNLPLQMVKRAPGAPVLLPAVMHWKAGHFAALIREAGDKYLVRDPTFGDELWVSRTALDEEASGYMLVGPQAWPEGWRPVEQSEGEQVWGKGQTDGNDPTQSHDDDPQAGGDGDDGDGDPGDAGDGGDGGDGDDDQTDGNNPSDDGSDNEDSADSQGGRDPKDDDSCGMPRYSMHLMIVSLHLKDTPVGHVVPRGPSMLFTVVYNQREANQPQAPTFSNLGPKWTHKWLSYIEDDPNNGVATAYLTVRGGGRDAFQNFNASTQSYQAETRTRAVLVRTSSSPIRYERRLANGAVEVFAQSDGAGVFPRRVFLTERHDRRGNTATFTYDGQLRLVAATDALGQVTTLSYDDPADSRRITRVTDPFGRFASFTYDTAGRLTQITDVLGLQSSFTYDGGDFITSLTTPYGTSRFVKGENGQDRWLEATDALGAKERVEYKMNAPVAVSDPAASVPVNVGVINNYLNYRNTFYWNKRAMGLAPRDPASAHRYHWLHTGGPLNQTSGVLESEQKPLEGRVWYRYPGQSSSIVEGTSRRPTVIARVLDDGTTQAWQWQYNDLNHVTKRIDPLGRETTYVYAANGIDLTEVRQTTGGMNDLLATFGSYTSGHRAQTITNAAGQTTAFTYNAHGQRLTATNAKSETTTYTYDSSGDGYLQSITGPTSGAVTALSYNAYGRPSAVTGSDGYTLTFDRDAMDRTTRITYPDATFEQFTYDRLDVSERRDRLGRTTKILRDALRHPVSVRDPFGLTSTFQWCNCGSLNALVDANGHKTSWERDLQGRVTREVRDDGLATLYAYELRRSRLKSITDRKGQVTTYAYGVDDTKQSITYANASTTTHAVSFTYDPQYRRVATMVDGTGTTTYAYKAIGALGARRLASVDGPLANDTIAYAYDELGRVTSRMINGVGITRSFDALGRVAAETNPLGAFAYTYDGATGRPATASYPNGQTTTYSYMSNASDRRLQTIWHQRSDSSTISRFDYAYDLQSNLASWSQQRDTNPAVLWQYEYDAADRLIAARKSSTATPPVVLKRYAYGFDAATNRTSEQIDDSVSGLTYDTRNQLLAQSPSGAMRFSGTVSEPATVSVNGTPAVVGADNHFAAETPVPTGTSVVSITARDSSGNAQTNQYQLTSTGANLTFAHDANGNLITDGTRTFTWDAEDRLIAVTSGSHTSTFSYDGLSRRVEVIEADSGVTSSDTKFVWCGWSICEARDASGTVLKRYFAQGVQDGGTAFFYTRDHLGSVQELTDGAGAVRARYDYDPSGRRTKISGDRDADVGFTGHYEHGPSHLTLAPFRAYDADLGRWISEDPMSLWAGPNLYAYAGGNPTTYVDPLGLALTSVDAAMRDAIMRGNVEEVKALLEISKDSLSAGMRRAAEIAVENESTTEGGMKSAAQLAKHLDKVSQAEEELAALKDQLAEAAKKAKDEISSDIKDLFDDIKGHLKEIRQKWGDICPKDPKK